MNHRKQKTRTQRRSILLKMSKSKLLDIIDVCVRFYNMPMKAVAPKGERRIRNRDGFMPVERYPLGLMPRVNEFGMDGKYRYFISKIASLKSNILRRSKPIEIYSL